VAIVQPLVTWTPELCRYTKEHLEQAEQEMWDRVRKSNDPNAQRFPGEIQCKWCKAKSTCPEYSRWIAVMVPTMTDLSTPVAEWTPEQRALFCERRSIAQAWLDDCEGQMKMLLAKDPESVPGWMLKEGQKRESVKDPQELFNRFVGEGGTIEQFMECVKITKGDLETQVRAVTSLKGKPLKAKLETLLEGITETKQNAPSLARKDK